MIVSNNPREDRAIKTWALVMVALVAVLTTVRACQAINIFAANSVAAYENEMRVYWSQRQ